MVTNSFTERDLWCKIECNKYTCELTKEGRQTGILSWN